jgi:hypothetical protein
MGGGSIERELMRRTPKDCTPRQWGCTSRFRAITSLKRAIATFPKWRSAAPPLWGPWPATRPCSPLSQTNKQNNWLEGGSRIQQQVRRVSVSAYFVTLITFAVLRRTLDPLSEKKCPVGGENYVARCFIISTFYQVLPKRSCHGWRWDV